MSNGVLEIFDASLQKTQVWLNDLMSELDWEEKPQKACLALRTALHALRDRLTVEEAVHLGAQSGTSGRAGGLICEPLKAVWPATPASSVYSNILS
jgi:uncharacterized protein (DUF2267 family)